MARSPLCVWCGKPAQPGLALCATCALGVDKYPDQNPPIVRAYFDAGLVEIDTFLKHHAEFARWLTEHPSKEGA